jgi:hypothetical protein
MSSGMAEVYPESCVPPQEVKRKRSRRILKGDGQGKLPETESRIDDAQRIIVDVQRTIVGCTSKGAWLRIERSSMCSEGSSVRSEGSSMRSEGSSIRSEGSSMRSEESSMCSERSSMRSEGSSMCSEESSMRSHPSRRHLADFPSRNSARQRAA